MIQDDDDDTVQNAANYTDPAKDASTFLLKIDSQLEYQFVNDLVLEDDAAVALPDADVEDVTARGVEEAVTYLLGNVGQLREQFDNGLLSDESNENKKEVEDVDDAARDADEVADALAILLEIGG